MALWTSHVAIAAPRNGTTSHTVSPSSGTAVAGSLFTPTAGRLLVCVVEGSVTSTTPSGWSLPSGGSAINQTGLYVWTKTAAGSDSVTTTHNGSNYAVMFHFFEFPSGSTFLGASSNNSVTSGGGGPSLTGLTGTNLHMHAFGRAIFATSGTGSVAWSSGTELIDSLALTASSTDGYLFSIAYVEDSAASSVASSTATWSGTAGGASTAERLTMAINVAAAADVRSATGALTIGLAAAATATKTGSSAGSLGIGMATNATDTKTGSAAGSLGMTLATAATDTKTADATGSLPMPMATAGTAAKTTSVDGALSLGLVGNGTAAKSIDATGALSFTLAGSGTAAKVIDAAGSLGFGLGGAGTVDKAGSAAGSLGVGLVLDGSASTEEIHSATGTLNLGLALAGSATKTGDVAGALGFVLTTDATDEKVGDATGALGLTITTDGSTTSEDTRSATGTLTLTVSLAGAADKTGATTGALNLGFAAGGTAVKDTAVTGALPLLITLIGSASIPGSIPPRDITFIATLARIRSWLATLGTGRSWVPTLGRVSWTGWIGDPMLISTLSKEYVAARLESRQANGSPAVVFDAQPIYLGLVLTGTAPQLGDFYPAEWVGTAATTRHCRMLVGPGGGVATYAAGTYDVWARVQDSTETAVRKINGVQVTFQ